MTPTPEIAVGRAYKTNEGLTVLVLYEDKYSGSDYMRYLVAVGSGRQEPDRLWFDKDGRRSNGTELFATGTDFIVRELV